MAHISFRIKESRLIHPSELRSHDSYILRICARHHSDMCKTSFRCVQDIIHKTSFTRHHSDICVMTPSNLFEGDMTHISFGYVQEIIRIYASWIIYITHTHTHTHKHTHTHTHTPMTIPSNLCHDSCISAQYLIHSLRYAPWVSRRACNKGKDGSCHTHERVMIHVRIPAFRYGVAAVSRID